MKKRKNYFNPFAVIVAVLILSLLTFSLQAENRRITVEVDGKPKQYDVIETKRYEIVEVEEAVKEVETLKSVVEQAISDAEKDASAHLNKAFWFSAGFFFPVGGTIISQWYQPFMPTARVLGKSPEYVAFYYDSYKVRTKKLQFYWALGGCLVGSSIGAWMYSIFF